MRLKFTYLTTRVVYQNVIVGYTYLTLLADICHKAEEKLQNYDYFHQIVKEIQ